MSQREHQEEERSTAKETGDSVFHTLKDDTQQHSHHNNLLCDDNKPLLVLKVGTSTMMQTQSLNFCLSNLGRFVDAVCTMKSDGYQVVLVCSGAVGAGCIHLKLHERPATLEAKQAASAVGQCRMMRLYEDLFAIREQKIAQLIITRPDLMDRTRFINFKNALKEILRLNVLPIINENDSIATANLHFGDNDTLAAYVAVSLGAQWLFLLTDVDCLYTQNPRLHPDAKPIPYVGHLDDVYDLLDEAESSGTPWGTGGMRTKIIAARIATATGTHTALCHGEHPERVLDVIKFVKAHAKTTLMWTNSITKMTMQNHLNASSTQEISVVKSETIESEGIQGLSHHHYHVSSVDSETLHPVSSKSNLQMYGSISACYGVGGGVDLSGVYSNQKQRGLVTAESLQAMPYLATIFAAQECTQNICDKRRWILSLPIRGRVYVDIGAALAVVNDKKSLFAAGITSIEGTFYEGEAVVINRDHCIRRENLHKINHKNNSHKLDDCLRVELNRMDLNKTNHIAGKLVIERDTVKENILGSHCHRHVMHNNDEFLTLNDGTELARCLINFSSYELNQIKGLKSCMFKSILGYECDSEVAHRDNIIFINPCLVYGCNGIVVDTSEDH